MGLLEEIERPEHSLQRKLDAMELLWELVEEEMAKPEHSLQQRLDVAEFLWELVIGLIHNTTKALEAKDA